MKPNVAHLVKKGGRISYNHGRPGHQGVEATVLAVHDRDMTVQFDDEADTTCIPNGVCGTEYDRSQCHQ
jgi:hypothetical protein